MEDFCCWLPAAVPGGIEVRGSISFLGERYRQHLPITRPTSLAQSRDFLLYVLSASIFVFFRGLCGSLLIGDSRRPGRELKYGAPVSFHDERSLRSTLQTRSPFPGLDSCLAR